MSMIDREKLIEEFEKWRDVFGDKEDNGYILMQSVIEEIEDQPPAVGINKQKLLDKLDAVIADFIENMEDGDYLRGNVNFAVVARKMIESQPPADQWIPCSSGRLPEAEGWYWITEDWHGLETRLIRFLPSLHHTFEEFMKCFDCKPVAWKPAELPEPYKGAFIDNDKERKELLEKLREVLKGVE